MFLWEWYFCICMKKVTFLDWTHCSNAPVLFFGLLLHFWFSLHTRNGATNRVGVCKSFWRWCSRKASSYIPDHKGQKIPALYGTRFVEGTETIIIDINIGVIFWETWRTCCCVTGWLNVNNAAGKARAALSQTASLKTVHYFILGAIINLSNHFSDADTFRFYYSAPCRWG